MGSSRTSTSGSPSRATARLTRLRWPPLRAARPPGRGGSPRSTASIAASTDVAVDPEHPGEEAQVLRDRQVVVHARGLRDVADPGRAADAAAGRLRRGPRRCPTRPAAHRRGSASASTCRSRSGPSRPVTPAGTSSEMPGSTSRPPRTTTEVAHLDDVIHHVLNCARGRRPSTPIPRAVREAAPAEPASRTAHARASVPSGASSASWPSKANSSRSAIRNRPSTRTQAGPELRAPHDGVDAAPPSPGGRSRPRSARRRRSSSPPLSSASRRRRTTAACRPGRRRAGLSVRSPSVPSAPPDTVAELGLGQRRDRHALAAQEGGHLLAAGERAPSAARTRLRKARLARIVPWSAARRRRSRPAARESGSTSRVSMRRARLNSPARRLEVGVADLREAVEPAPVGDPVRRQRRVAAEVAAGAGEEEQQLEGARAAREDGVPGVGLADHRVPEPEGADRELDRHRRHAQRVGARLDDLATVGEDVGDHVAVADPRQVVGAAASTGSAGPPGAGPSRTARPPASPAPSVADDPVVEADHRGVVLGDGEVLVVAQVGDGFAVRLADADAGADAGHVEADPGESRPLLVVLPTLSRVRSAS